MPTWRPMISRAWSSIKGAAMSSLESWKTYPRGIPNIICANPWQNKKLYSKDRIRLPSFLICIRLPGIEAVDAGGGAFTAEPITIRIVVLIQRDCHISIRQLPYAPQCIPQEEFRVSPIGLSDATQAVEVGICAIAHRLLHIVATQLLNAGCRITSIQKFLGHKKLSTAMIYTCTHRRCGVPASMTRLWLTTIMPP